MNKKKMAFVHSLIALLLCVSMLMGTTFAWFTDSVSSGKNQIVAGNLDVVLEYMDANGNWNPVTEATNVFEENTLWEPGHTEVVYLKVSNAGTLALKYQLGINIASETGSVNMAGEGFMLSNHIRFAVIEDVQSPFASRDAAREAVTAPNPLAFGYSKEAVLNPGDAPHCVAMVVYMPEEAGNEVNYRTGENPPEIKLGINLFASQQIYETDSFDNSYDGIAEFPKPDLNVSVAAPVGDKVDNGVISAAMTVGGAATGVTAEVPQGVALADEATTLTLSVKSMDETNANITMGENDISASVDVHMDGVAENNTVPMLITLEGYLPLALNTGALKLYHVENGTPVPMTQVANPVNHNEFSYDSGTGTVVLALASFSEVAAVADSNNSWDGTAADKFNSGSGTETDPYLISTADELAYFRNQVDSGRSFAGEYVALKNHIQLDGFNFDPIGWGYVNSGWNAESVDGKVFQGTFDGKNNTIYNLYQSGWDLESSTGTDYTYTNCGFGLFAAASGATFQNLTINGASVTVECVEAGVLVGLSQNGCTYNNINIHNAKVANYQRPAGGLIGEVSGTGTTAISDVTIGSDVVVGSLWGDFDAPCGGVIGARWDDADADPQIVMTNVEVGCRMDVYSDVTAAYQWYAYRRAGMLIGNTELTATDNKHLAAAPFLTCENVKIYYGNWAAYHYCQFTNQDNAWCNNYPWVRVEAGENCSAYSNPRYGQPVVGGVTVAGDTHTCTADHKMELRFNQLYGGGQGVYGQPAHDGVEVVEYRYSITYINDEQVLAIKYVTEEGAVTTQNSAAQDLVEKWATENITEYDWEFGGWMNAGSTKLTEIAADNEDNIVLYPYFNKPYTASFVDQHGNILAWCFFNEENVSQVEATKESAQALLPYLGEDYVFDYWEVRGTKADGTVIKEEYGTNEFTSYGTDVTLYPYYIYKGALQLIPVDSDNDGDTDYYRVDASEITREGQDVTIPDYVNGVPVTVINSGAFDDGKLRDVYLPNTIEEIGKNAFCKDDDGGFLDNGEFPQIQIIFDGTKAEWDALKKEDGWDDNIGTGSVIICTRESTPGYYLQNGSNGIWGSGIRIDWQWNSGSYPDWYPRTAE